MSTPTKIVCKWYETSGCTHGISGKENGLCKRLHPTTDCRDFPNCPRGDACFFKHPYGKGRSWYSPDSDPSAQKKHAPAPSAPIFGGAFSGVSSFFGFGNSPAPSKPSPNKTAGANALTVRPVNGQTITKTGGAAATPNSSLLSVLSGKPHQILQGPGIGKQGLQTISYTNTVVEDVKVKKRCPVQLKILIDKSGSMSGSRYRECMAAVREILPELKDGDYVGMATFAGSSGMDRFQTISSKGHAKEFVNIKEMKKLEHFVDQVESAGANGGGTALYAAIIDEGRRFKAYAQLPNLQHILVVVTDGEDNASGSKVTPEVVNDALHRLEEETENLNLTVIILPIGIEEKYEEEMRKMIRGAPTSKQFPNGRPRLGDLHSVKDSTVLKSIFTTEIKKVMKTEKQTVRIMHDRNGNATVSYSANAQPMIAAGGGSKKGLSKKDKP